MKLLNIMLFFIIYIPSSIYAQINYNNKIIRLYDSVSKEIYEPSKENSNLFSLPIFDIHIGAGLITGGHLGVRVKTIKSLSVEASYGVDLRNLIALSDGFEIYGGGLNWHFNKKNKLLLSLIFAYSRGINLSQEDLYISPMLGWFSSNETGINLLLRGGIFLRKDIIPGNGQTYLFFNVDINLGYVFY